MNGPNKLVSNPCQRRCFATSDKKALYQICLKTGDAGKDASQIFRDVNLLGDLYVGPYLEYPSGLAWTIEDEVGICGYVLGVANTLAYHRWHLNHWLPRIRKGRRLPEKDEDDWTMDDTLLASLFEFEFDHPDWLEQFPAHIHIDLLPRVQGRGLGTRFVREMLDAFCDQNCRGVHLGMHPENHKALSFYQKLGFEVLEHVELKWEEVLYLGMCLK